MILVTGATGFIGSHLVNRLRKEHEEVLSMVHDSPVWTKWLAEAVKPTRKVRGDIRDTHFLRRVLNQYDVSEVYHLAALPVVAKAQKDPVNTFDVNVMGTVKLLQVCREMHVEKVLVQSTDKAYGEGLDKTVSDPLKPVEAYGLSKACQDWIAQYFMNICNMKIIITRPCNAYGYDLNPRIIPNTVRACMQGEKPVVWKWEESKRAYIYVEDLVDALVYLMANHEKGIFNIATRDVLTPEEVVKTVLKFFPFLEPKYETREKPTEICQQSLRMNPFGWGPRYSFQEGIKLTIEKYMRYGF